MYQLFFKNYPLTNSSLICYYLSKGEEKEMQMLNENDLKCIEEQFSDVIQKNDYFVKTKQWIICKFDVDTKPVAIYHNSGKLYKLMGTVDTIENALRDMKLYEQR